jgi:hypothetical protein
MVKGLDLHPSVVESHFHVDVAEVAASVSLGVA